MLATLAFRPGDGGPPPFSCPAGDGRLQKKVTSKQTIAYVAHVGSTCASEDAEVGPTSATKSRGMNTKKHAGEL